MRPGLHVWRFPFADYLAATLSPTLSPFARSRFMNVQPRSRGSATLPRRYAHPPTRVSPTPAGYRDRMVAQGDCRDPEAVARRYRHHLHQLGRVSGLSYCDQ
jgi:hypothetical protein